MADATEPRVNAIWRYPVKGLAGERMEQVTLEAGCAVPFDRTWAIENGASRFDPANPKHLPKISFLMLMRNERLASLGMQFDESNQTLTITRDGKQVAKGALDQPIGRTMLEQFFAAYMKDELRGAPRIVHASGHTFSDIATPCIHIINLETIRDIERKTGEKIAPERFRANIYLDGLPAWEEFDWLDRDITAGSVKLRGLARTDRCDATNVNPETAARDMSIPRQLQRHYGHIDVGIYATVKAGGVVSAGDGIGICGS